MTVLTRSAPFTVWRFRLPCLWFPNPGSGAKIAAICASITHAYSMVYVEPFKSRAHQPRIFDDVDLEGRDANW